MCSHKEWGLEDVETAEKGYKFTFSCNECGLIDVILEEDFKCEEEVEYASL